MKGRAGHAKKPGSYLTGFEVGGRPLDSQSTDVPAGGCQEARNGARRSRKWAGRPLQQDVTCPGRSSGCSRGGQK